MDQAERRKIIDIEKELVREKPWQLKGEIGAHARPVNSLLFEDVQFEQRVKAPEITEQTDQSLEDIIKQRIKDKRFDDPVRKTKPLVAPSSRNVEVSSEKSKIGLAQLYEQELLAKTTSGNQTKDGPEKEVERKLRALCRKLDALCER